MDQDPISIIKLTRTEFAVVRAYAQGMKPQDIVNRYLVGHDDEELLSESEAIQRILGLRDRLIQFALQHNQPEIAAMVESLRGRTDVGMTRRIDALSSLEQLDQSRPEPQHEVSLWFRPSLARRLAAANLRRIGELTALANARGSSWWRAVPRIGVKSAEIITAWLIRHCPVMGDRSLHSYVIPPSGHRRRAPLAPLALGPAMAYPVPLECMLAPCPSLPPSVQHALSADLAFIRAWLGTHAGTPRTLQSYRREAERLLLWAARQRKALQQLTFEDLCAYQDFLAGPEPILFWCGPSGPRDREHWRPFERALRPSSIAAAMRVVRALLGAMAKAVIRHGPVMGDRSQHSYVIPLSGRRRRAPVAPLPLGPAMAYPVPLERMLAPCPSLGTSVQHALSADLAFIRAWLSTHAGTPRTLQSYCREAERLLLWAARQRKALQQLTFEDLCAYQDFLASPEPILFWCGSRGPRGREHWRPFERALRPSSIAAAMRVVRALLGAMAKAGHLYEPARPTNATPTRWQQSLRQPHTAHREAFFAWLDSPGQSERHHAAHAAALLMGRSGFHLVELPSLRGVHVRYQDNRVGLVRPAGSEELVWLHPETWQALCRHMTDRGLDARQLPAEAALLAPQGFPATRRGRRKQLAGSAAGYAASGLDHLLRAVWLQFCRAHDLPAHSLTPRQIAGLAAA